MLGCIGRGSEPNVLHVLLMLACYISNQFSLLLRHIVRSFKGSASKKVLSLLNQKPNVHSIFCFFLTKLLMTREVTVTTRGVELSRTPVLWLHFCFLCLSGSHSWACSSSLFWSQINVSLEKEIFRQPACLPTPPPRLPLNAAHSVSCAPKIWPLQRSPA